VCVELSNFVESFFLTYQKSNKPKTLMNSSKSRKTPFSLHIFINNFTDLTHHKIYVSLKGPKHEIFGSEFFYTN
jgi:hypothetical protein